MDGSEATNPLNPQAQLPTVILLVWVLTEMCCRNGSIG